eukprot:TRINITY_DN51388_c0_g1_i4.p4 TRINITY_DN51388_c0_g1~~TRINITY_DN51388_c0_g1_i4.p4  ORF type:complete len:104 (-),score=4.06 TRINITY_DN51388_c0_g1_i4:558-869(-)
MFGNGMLISSFDNVWEWYIVYKYDLDLQILSLLRIFKNSSIFVLSWSDNIWEQCFDFKQNCYLWRMSLLRIFENSSILDTNIWYFFILMVYFYNASSSNFFEI